MARMIEALEVASGDRVLEIGTGSGDNAALLCERLGSDHVTTVDIDGGLVEAARERLELAGDTPTVAVSDGAGGYPAGAPFDRIIATCLVDRIPRAWIEQTRPGGRMIAPVPANLAQLTVMPDGSAAGRFHPQGVGFMGMVGGAPTRWTWPALVSLANQPGEGRPRRHPIDVTQAGGKGSPFWSFVRLLAIPFDAAFPAAPGMGGLVDLSDQSWVRLELDGDNVTQGGPRRLWDLIEELFDEWRELGRPGRERFGLTVAADDRHTVWLDAPDSPQDLGACRTDGAPAPLTPSSAAGRSSIGRPPLASPPGTPASGWRQSPPGGERRSAACPWVPSACHEPGWSPRA